MDDASKQRQEKKIELANLFKTDEEADAFSKRQKEIRSKRRKELKEFREKKVFLNIKNYFSFYLKK